MSRLGSRCSTIALLLLVPSTAAAQATNDGDDGTRPTPPAIAAPPPASTGPIDQPAPSWRPKRTIRVSTADYFVTGAGAAGALVGALMTPLPKHARGGVLLDEDARDLVRLDMRNARYHVRDASDVGVSLLTTWPFLVDALITTWWYRGDLELAKRMTVVNAETFALAAAVQGITNTMVSRERPYGRLCGTTAPNDGLPDASVDCEGNVHYRSFFSGHATLSFASAGLLCTHHLGLGLLGPPWDTLTCATSVAMAGTTALFRMMSDMHYLSDVTVGAVFGSAMGLVIPWLHLGPAPNAPVTGLPKPDVRVAPVGQGLGLVGTF